jgi:ribosomal protein L16 Arg81 hydroxylase
MPEDAEVVELGPGGMLFVPRGWWHETRASGASLQINFVFNGPMGVDVLIRSLKAELLRDPAWREYAYDVFGSDRNREASLARFSDLLDGLRDRLDATDRAALAAELVNRAGLRPAGGGGP